MSRNNASDLLVTQEPLDSTQEEPIPLRPKILQRFFEPIVLLVALIDAVKHTAKPPEPEPEVDAMDPKQLFHAFVNKLGHVCDSEKGGDTVTSFVLLKNERSPEWTQYVFASNRQTDSQLRNTAAYVETLLRKVNQAPQNPAEQYDTRIWLLYHILRFNRRRVSFYLRELHSQAAFCLNECRKNRTNENSLIAEELEKILACPSAGSKPKDSESDYIRICAITIQLLIRIEKSRAGALVKDRALAVRMAGHTSMEGWSKFLHMMMRILAYPQSTQFFLRAKMRWPNLFRNATVSFISSSRPITKPGRQKSLTADSIVGRMTSKEKEMDIFRRFAETLQAFHLDIRIQDEYGKDSFRPIVHSEVLLLNWISKQGEVAPSRFFNDWMYIGSSKATCKLCDYYFHEHRTDVEHRKSHGNLYPSWRVPDVFPHQGQAGLDSRQIMLDRVLQRVRKDAFDIVRKKALPSVKGDDSNTFSARMTLEEIGSLHGSNTKTDIDDLASMVGELDIE